MTAGPLIEIESLRVTFRSDDGRATHAVDAVDLLAIFLLVRVARMRAR
jgi:hypothetical protein